MKWIEYAPLALRTAKPLPHHLQCRHALLGIVTEVGELADAIKRTFIYGKELDVNNVRVEIGDACWYINLFMAENAIAPVHIDTMLAAWEPSKIDDVDQTLLIAAHAGALCVPPSIRGVPDALVIVKLVDALATIGANYGISVSECLDLNVEKLSARYKGDIYSNEAALNRDIAAENAITGENMPVR